MNNKNHSRIKRLATNKWVVGIALLAVISLATVEIRELRRQLEVQKEIKALRAQAEALQRENNELQRLSEYLKSDDYLEKAAREQLNKKKEGEYVYSFSQPANTEIVVAAPETKEERAEKLSNPGKWWNYFFDRSS